MLRSAFSLPGFGFLCLLWPVFLQGQDLKEKLQGDWLCTHVSDSANQTIRSEFGESEEYLRFSFRGIYLSIARAPFDRGLIMPVRFSADSFDPILEVNWFLPFIQYKVVKVDAAGLIIQADVNRFYHFTNQSQYKVDLPSEQARETGIIVIANFMDLQNGYYKISNREPHILSPFPIFSDDYHPNLGSYLAAHFKFPKSFKEDSLTTEFIAEFEVTKRGLKNLQIIKGVNFEVNSAAYAMLWSTRRKWHPIMQDGLPITTKLRFRIVFYKT